MLKAIIDSYKVFDFDGVQLYVRRVCHALSRSFWLDVLRKLFPAAVAPLVYITMSAPYYNSCHLCHTTHSPLRYTSHRETCKQVPQKGDVT